MPQITIDNTTELARYDFNGASLPTEWNILQQGTGMVVSVANSIMSIAAGTTAGDQTIVRCTNKFQIKSYVRFIAQLSQRIANQNIYLELINEAGTTFARYDFNGTTATSVQCQTGSGGNTNTATTVTCPTTANYGTFDIYADLQDVVFSSSASNTNAVKSGISAFDRLILDPDEYYYAQVRVLNGATAPASSTTVNIDAVALQDLTGLKVDVSRGDGVSALTNAAPVQVVNSPSVAQSGTWTFRNNIYYTESTTAQAANATLTGTSRDTAIAAGTVQQYAKFNAFAFSDQAGTMRIEVSADNTTWRRATVDTAVAASTPVYLTVPVLNRYHRVVYVNGATLQTQFMLNSGYTIS